MIFITKELCANLLAEMFKKFIIFFLLLLLAAGNLFAEQEDSQNKDFGYVSWVDIDMGPIVFANIVFRGATFYRFPIVMPGAAIKFFDDTLQIKGPSLLFNHVIGQNLKIKSSLALIVDNAYLGFIGDQLAFRKQRDNAFEFSVGALYSPFKILDLEANFYQELIEHHGQYYDIGFSLKVLRIVGETSPVVFGSVFSTLGLADKRHNRFLYGNTADSGLSNIKSGVSFVFPKLFLNTTLITSIYYDTVLGSSNRSAPLVSDRRGSFSGMLYLKRRLPI